MVSQGFSCYTADTKQGCTIVGFWDRPGFSYYCGTQSIVAKILPWLSSKFGGVFKNSSSFPCVGDNLPTTASHFSFQFLTDFSDSTQQFSSSLSKAHAIISTDRTQPLRHHYYRLNLISTSVPTHLRCISPYSCSPSPSSRRHQLETTIPNPARCQSPRYNHVAHVLHNILLRS